MIDGGVVLSQNQQYSVSLATIGEALSKVVDCLHELYFTGRTFTEPLLIVRQDVGYSKGSITLLYMLCSKVLPAMFVIRI